MKKLSIFESQPLASLLAMINTTIQGESESTITITRRGFSFKVAGLSVFKNVPSEKLDQAFDEGLERMKDEDQNRVHESALELLHCGSLEDLKCTLNFCSPKSLAVLRQTLIWTDEKGMKTASKILTAKIKQLEKLSSQDSTNNQSARCRNIDRD